MLGVCVLVSLLIAVGLGCLWMVNLDLFVACVLDSPVVLFVLWCFVCLLIVLCWLGITLLAWWVSLLVTVLSFGMLMVSVVVELWCWFSLGLEFVG